ncbi:MAG: ATP-binding protein [Lachnospiraceae bacterium]
MKIKTLYLKRFGRFTEKTIKLDDGINVIYGFNESGKSTISFFIFAMLFGLDDEKDKNGEYIRFYPWTNEKDFGGSMDFVHNGVNYRLTRTFYGQNKTVKLVNLDSGREMIPAERGLSELFPGLSRKDYMNSYFCMEGSSKPDETMAAELKKHAVPGKEKEKGVVDTDYALRILDDRRRSLSDTALESRIKELEDIIEKEEKTERRLDEIASMEQAGQDEIKALNARLEGNLLPSVFEEKEKEYYQHKERYQVYKKDLDFSRELSEQLDKVIRVREDLESNSSKLERCKEELNTVRIFKKKNQENTTRTRQEIESAGRLLLTESKNNIYIQTVFLVCAIILIIAGIVLELENVTVFYPLLVFLGAIAATAMFVVWTLKWKINKNTEKEEIQKLRENLKDYQNEYELFFRAHSSEEELVGRYEECLKEDGRIPEIIEKEKDLSNQLEKLDKDLAIREEELLQFFAQFGMVEDLKEDELVLQEENLRNAKENRLREVEEAKAGISELNESMIKMHMQVEAGEENEANLLKHRDERSALLEKRKESMGKIKAIELAMHMIEELAGEDYDSFGKIINQKASGYAASFTGNQYTSFITDDKLNCRVDYYDKYVSVENLSSGAEAQMNLVLRLSIGDLLLADYDLPLVFDDAFVYYDDARLAGTLMEISKKTEQIIIFTCQSREETILNQLNLEYVSVNL